MSNIELDTVAEVSAGSQSREALAAAAHLESGREGGGAHVSLKCGT